MRTKLLLFLLFSFIFFSGCSEDGVGSAIKSLPEKVVPETSPTQEPVCSPSTEICDGFDNDCDSEIDEGELCFGGESCLEGKCKILGFQIGLRDSIYFPFEEDGVAVQVMDSSVYEKPEFFGFVVELIDEPVVEFVKKQESTQNNALPKSSIQQNALAYKATLIEKQTLVEAEVKEILPKALVEEQKFQDAFNGFIVNEISEEEVAELESLPEVKKVYPNYKVELTLMDSVPLINADDVWLLTDDYGNFITGEGISIGIIDTGVDYTHSDLGGCFGAGCKVVGGYDFVNDDSDPLDDHGHGTHVAATAAGNGTLKGVAPNAKIYAYKAVDKYGIGYDSSIISAIERAMDPNQDGDFSDHLDVINLSLGVGSSYFSNCYQIASSVAVDNAVDAGIVAVVAAGNDGDNFETISAPGCAIKVVTVGASDKSDNIASFSSRGPTKDNRVKPDFVAPGVSICAAQWGSAWEGRECFDEDHVAINGTSMAAPHVAGAVALVKQTHPDWTPEEIKMALRKTAVDTTNNDILSQGYGRIDVFGAVELNHRPCIARISPVGYWGVSGLEVSGLIDIKGNSFCEDFKNYSLYYEDDGQWQEIYFSDTQVFDSVLYSGFNTFNLDEGIHKLKLVTRNIYDEEYEDVILFSVNNFFIAKIGGTLNYIREEEIVLGYIGFPEYEAYKVDYQKKGEETWNQVCYETTALVDHFLCSINVDSFENGVYYFRLSVLKGGTWLQDFPFKAIVIQELEENWPEEKFMWTKGRIVVEDIDNDESNELLVPNFGGCNSSSCGGSSLYIFETNASSKRISWLYKDNEYYSDVFDDIMPSIYYDEESNENLISLVNEWLDDVGLIDFEQNFAFSWPKQLFSENDFQNLISPSIIAELNKGQEKKILASSLDYGNDMAINIWAFDKNGDIFDNFPIVVQKEGSGGTIASRGVYPMKYNQDTYLGVIAGNYDNSKSESAIKLYFDLYSTQGNLINRTLLFDAPAEKFDIGMFNIVLADLTNNKNTEMVFGFSVLDLDLLMQGRCNSGVVQTHIYVIDSQGNLVSEPYAVDDYVPLSIGIGDFGEENLNMVVAFSNTCAEEYCKIASFDYLGNTLFDLKLDNKNELIQALTIGDIDNDNESDIVVNYRPRWYGGNNSGIKFYNKEGILKKEIVLPTFGQADDFRGFYPILTDFDKDGKIEIVQQSEFVPFEGQSKARIYVFDLNADYNKSNIDWPMFLHDPQHTGIYKKYCSNGTPYEECSLNQPWFCDNGNLVDDCWTCGCPNNLECKLKKPTPGVHCYPPEPEPRDFNIMG